mgnify:CR=1 FL=1
MKKTYIKPQTQAVNLYAEDTMLAGSTYVVDKDNTTDVVLSNGKSWSSDDWTDDEE